MPKIEKSALVSHSAERMYQLVNDIESYPEFLPGCQQSRIIEQSESEVTAELVVSQAGISKAFTTCNRLVPGKSIEMVLVDGPFKYLQGIWHFKPLAEDACKVEFELEFEFSSQLVGVAFGRVFQQMAESMVQAFIHRAKKQ
ncbi:type II toxin-antitoxin system RatA family toxin [Pleionea sp. CnH1-48]|uniref:type II toxin-antitoxin system RatA family toxin n=1 Tax=Pleionea sp. CnH1-48 TaxID=2954494 RepID=UPI00273A60D9|nr:type II toxin-antitoxin system RatA family toxin [Pleionea sp. CnH1-48]